MFSDVTLKAMELIHNAMVWYNHALFDDVTMDKLEFYRDS